MAKKPARGGRTSETFPNYRRAARLRLQAAQTLFAQGLFVDAAYLGGYVEECSLKALLLARTPVAQRAAIFATISVGQRSHDLEMLRRRLTVIGCHMPQEILDYHWSVTWWTPSLRYETTGSAQVAEALLEAVAAVNEWMERSL